MWMKRGNLAAWINFCRRRRRRETMKATPSADKELFKSKIPHFWPHSNECINMKLELARDCIHICGNGQQQTKCGKYFATVVGYCLVANWSMRSHLISLLTIFRLFVRKSPIIDVEIHYCLHQFYSLL